MPRGDQLTRQWRLVHLLTSRTGRTLAQFQAELAVSKRTVQRDLEDLQAVGFPVVSEPRNGTMFWRFADGFRAEAAISLTLSEMMALYFSRSLLKPLQGTGLNDALESVMRKIGAALPPQGHSLLNSLGEGIQVSNFGAKDFNRSSEVIQKLMKGLLDHYTVEISHTAPGRKEATRRKVDPYKLWYANNGLYLVGFDHRSEENRTFAVHRIDSVSVTNLRFKIPKSFNFDEFSDSAFQMRWGEPHHVAIRFRADQAPYVTERTWHHSQKILPQDDGGVILEMDIADPEEVRRWLIGFGAASEVIQPLELRKKMAEELRLATNVYKPAKNPSRT
ncbi:MAG: WYL domain-containing protein [Acidobacteriaceae bacterium]|nr:WYL domain-containing protein [Acidobacteriaceae bacterium]